MFLGLICKYLKSKDQILKILQKKNVSKNRSCALCKYCWAISKNWHVNNLNVAGCFTNIFAGFLLFIFYLTEAVLVQGFFLFCI